MQKTILVTGATDGIGLETAKALVQQGHHVLIHGRNADKVTRVAEQLHQLTGAGKVDSYVADLSRLEATVALAQAIQAEHRHLDVIINNAGVYKTAEPITAAGLDARFVVNTLAPYLLTQRLLPLLSAGSRVVNLSSAAQAPVNVQAMAGQVTLAEPMAAYAQSKLAITMWSRHLAQALHDQGIVVVAVNPGSLLATRMVREGFGTAGNDIAIGVNILLQAALDVSFAQASGQYFDNDAGRFAAPHADALDDAKVEAVVAEIERLLHQLV